MVEVIKFVRFEIRKPFFDPNPHKTTTQNHEWRQGLFMIFSYKGRYLWYMPKFSTVDELNKKCAEIDEINKELCKKNNSNV